MPNAILDGLSLIDSVVARDDNVRKVIDDYMKSVGSPPQAAPVSP